MTSPEYRQPHESAEDAGGATGTRGRIVATVGAIAVLLLAGVAVAGIAVARGWGVGTSTATGTGRAAHETTAPTSPADPYKMASNVCTASRADMERWVTVARDTYPDAERFADFLGHEAAVIDMSCPGRRPTYDDATWAAADIRIGTTGKAP